MKIFGIGTDIVNIKRMEKSIKKNGNNFINKVFSKNEILYCKKKMKTSFNFLITRKEGINFSKLSGDTNKIHINERTGYNSYFGFNICHGVLVLFKFFKINK